MNLVAIDIGGTHARFAIAEVAEGQVLGLGEPTTLPTADHASFEAAWEAFARTIGTLPRAAAIAVAAPVNGETIALTNNKWTITRAQLDLVTLTIVNDFEAVGHAVAQAGPEHFGHLCGPEGPLPASGTISVIGPGTGLGVASVWRGASGYHVQASEGGHIGFAAVDDIDDAIVARLRKRHGRVSVERVVSGPGLAEIYAALSGGEPPDDDKALWAAGLSGEDLIASDAIDRFCLSLGRVAGDIALAQGGAGVVIAGGLGLRIGDVLTKSRFAEGFCAKGRFAGLMASLPVKLVTHPQPGLFGAAAAFAREHP